MGHTEHALCCTCVPSLELTWHCQLVRLFCEDCSLLHLYKQQLTCRLHLIEPLSNKALCIMHPQHGGAPQVKRNLHKCSSMSYLQCLLLCELYSITHAGPILPGIRVCTYTLQRLQLLSHTTLHVTNTLCMRWLAANSQHMCVCACTTMC